MPNRRAFSVIEETWGNRQIVRIVFDAPDRPVTVLTPELMKALDDELQRLMKHLPAAVILESAKPDIFIAGADIRVIEQISSSGDARLMSRDGQDILHKLHALPCPTFAAIDGAALGGGLETALFCDYRVVSDHPKTRMGLPEVTLGIIPGFGGTQTLPRLIGLRPALDLILSGRQIDGRRAQKLGLADSCAPRAIFSDHVRSFVMNHPGKVPIPRRTPPVYLLREIFCSLANREVQKKTMGNYPAPLKAIEAIRRGVAQPLSEGLKIEAELFSVLPQTVQCRNLIRTFFQTEKYKKWVQPNLEEKQDLARRGGLPKTCAVIGAGTMGAGIAYQLASSGFPVRLKDVDPKFIQKGLGAIDKILKTLVSKKRLTAVEARNIRTRISPTLDLHPLRAVDLVIEAVIEDLTLKRKVFDDLERSTAEGAVMATNTSSLPIEKIAAGRKSDGRFVGLHFFNPVDKMPLVEIVVGPNTSDETTAFAVEFVKRIKKTPIVVRDQAGFLVNRLLMPYLNEAAHLLVEGARIEHIDGAARKFGMPMGPLFLLDVVGLDVAHKVAGVLESAFGERMRPCPLLERLQKEGRLGQKNGIGFYIHSSRGKAPDAALEVKSQTPIPIATDEILDRLILSMVNEAARALEDGVVSDAETVDVGMLLGTGFPPFRGGLLKYADDRGIPEIVERLYALSEECGMRFAPAAKLVDMSKKRLRFHGGTTLPA